MIKDAKSESDREFNHDLSTRRALKIIAEFSPMISFRVSPKGSTPAFADSKNISMLGVGGDQFLQARQVFYICWEATPTMAVLTERGFAVKGIDYLFQSKSGGEVLNECLFARYLMYYLYDKLKSATMIPRMTSLMVVTNEEQEKFIETFQVLQRLFPVLTLHHGSRAMV
jgi:hypothetical protein